MSSSSSMVSAARFASDDESRRGGRLASGDCARRWVLTCSLLPGDLDRCSPWLTDWERASEATRAGSGDWSDPAGPDVEVDKSGEVDP